MSADNMAICSTQLGVCNLSDGTWTWNSAWWHVWANLSRSADQFWLEGREPQREAVIASKRAEAQPCCHLDYGQVRSTPSCSL
eukprot:1597143-Amphidinium_carterae.1